MNTNLRPPTPGMRDAELVQWHQRVYDAIKALETALNSVPGQVTSHDNLTENGGAGSHTTISNHIAATNAHGAGSPLAGINDIATLTQKVISGLHNTLSDLRHGIEVDNPTAAHGAVGAVAGTENNQEFTNKLIDGLKNTLSNLRHGLEVDNPTSAHGVTGDIVGTGGQQTIRQKTVIRSVRTALTSGPLSSTDDVVRVFEINLIMTLPTVETGRMFTIENVSLGECEIHTIDGKLIQGEMMQILPQDSSVDLLFDGVEWRFV